MGSKKVIKTNHFKSNLDINTCQICKNCPIKLYAKPDDKIIFGIGNITTDTIMILPIYDIKSNLNYITIFDILRDNYNKIVGKDILEDNYITRYIKCINKTDFNLEKHAIRYCSYNLYYEIRRINPRKIISFDNNYIDIISSFPVKIFNVMNPAVMYYNNNILKDKFIEQLTKAVYDNT